MSKVSDWLTFAENDLKTARAALGEDVTNNACFNAQQTVEKSLKAVLLANEQEIPKVHDLLFLLERARKHIPDLSKFEEGIRFLNQFYVPMRYPDALPGGAAEGLPSKEESQKAIDYAQEILDFTLSKLGPTS